MPDAGDEERRPVRGSLCASSCRLHSACWCVTCPMLRVLRDREGAATEQDLCDRAPRRSSSNSEAVRTALPTIPTKKLAKLVTLALKGRHTAPKLARRVGLASSTVYRVLRAYGLETPSRTGMTAEELYEKLGLEPPSRMPATAEKVYEVLGLYLNPPMLAAAFRGWRDGAGLVREPAGLYRAFLSGVTVRRGAASLAACVRSSAAFTSSSLTIRYR